VLFVPGLAAFVDGARRRPLAVPAALLGLLVAFNLLFALDVREGRLPPTGSIRGIDIVESITQRTGNPLSFPMNIWFAWRHGTDLGHYERLGTQTFNNLRVDVGGTGDDRFLAGGWAGRESNGTRSFRWGLGESSLVLAPLKQPDRYRLRFEAEPFGRRERQRQTLTVEINGTTLDQITMRPGMRTYELPVSADMLRAGVNELRFRYGYAISPRQLDGSRDERPLAVRFVWIELLRG
jgi:hypothetical protein